MSDERVRALLREIERELEGTGRTIYDVLGAPFVKARPATSRLDQAKLEELVAALLTGLEPTKDPFARSVLTITIKAVSFAQNAGSGQSAWAVETRETWEFVAPSLSPHVDPT